MFFGVYFELVVATLLAPAPLTPASVRLYNLMHYGHSAVLSAMVAIMLLSAAIVVVGLAALRRLTRHLASRAR